MQPSASRSWPARHLVHVAILCLGAAVATAACHSGGDSSSRGPGHVGDDGGDAMGVAVGDGGVHASPLVISTATRRPRQTTWSVNYWMWSPTYGSDLAGTEALVAALAPAMMRVGGYNNDANRPDPFDDAELDAAIAYARAIGAEPLLQVPHIADNAGMTSTAATAAAMVRYANLTRGYGVKYFSVGNEPDLYATTGLPSDPTKPAFPGYTPSDYCASVRTYVTAMKNVDPTIRIVGPDLAWKYQRNVDWLTPILQGCGDLFDVISVHRYPFSSVQATLPVVAADVPAFRGVLASIRGLMQAAGYGQKPLALMEMNLVYDATPAGYVLEASPGTVPSALWLADSLGVAIESNLWTSAVWDISDPDDWSLGLIGLPPAHAPRPEYYAYALYAAHFGPTLVDVTAAPAGVSAHASRNQADDATEVIVINWNRSPQPVAFEVTGLAQTPAPAIYVLPGLSLSAVEVPDGRRGAAWTYADAQHRAGSGAQPLSPSAGTVVDAGADDAGDGGGAGDIDAAADGPFQCPGVVLPVAAITTLGKPIGAILSYGMGSAAWSSFTYAGSGQPLPTIAVSPDGNGLQIAAQLLAPTAANDYAGAGLYYTSMSCVDASAYAGVEFDFTGTLGGCALTFAVADSGHISTMNDPARGACAESGSPCYGPSVAVVPGSTPIKLPFSALGGGSPVGGFDTKTIISVQWQLTAPLGAADGGGCTASFTIENAVFY